MSAPATPGTSEGFIFDEDNTGTSHDDSEFSDPEADAAMAANNAEVALMQALAGPRPAEKTEDEINLDYMNEVDRRLSVANCYRELLENPLFGDQDENTEVVEREVRNFVMQRLQVLMGARADGPPMLVAPPKPQFNDAEVQAVRSVLAFFHASGTSLQRMAGFSEREALAIRKLAEVALKNKIIPDAQAAAGAQPRPAVRRRPTTSIVPPPAAPPPAVAPTSPPKPAATPPPQPAQRPVRVPTRAPSRRSTRASAPSAPSNTEPTTPLVKTVVREVPATGAGDGGTHVTTVQRIQRPAGMVAFPADPRSMEIATAAQAGAAAVAHQRSILEDKTAVGFK